MVAPAIIAAGITAAGPLIEKLLNGSKDKKEKEQEAEEALRRQLEGSLGQRISGQSPQISTGLSPVQGLLGR
tara:strand:+ start:14510 stop:14725 length:216 start_codon:yes stop_codon:yes gene_type:complete